MDYDSHEVCFDMTRCIYADMTRKYNCLELCPLFCTNDVVAFAGFQPSIIFKREKTISNIARGNYKMKFCILMASPRLRGNTAELLKPFLAELEDHKAEFEYITLSEKNIKPCLGCYVCQNVSNQYGCIQQDDVLEIMNSIIAADCVVLATPIYSWFCTAPMKALLDRHYGLNKFYGSAKGSLWAGKKIAIISTHGYDAEYGAGPFETGIKRLCEHSNLEYMGMYSVRDEDDLASFQTEEAIRGSKLFARRLMSSIN